MQPDLSTYRLAVVADLRRAGYADSPACALAERFPGAIRAGYELNLAATEVAAEIARIDDEEGDTPTVVMTAGEMKEAVLDSIERAIEEGR